jgi:hypothetical protein
MIWKPSKECYGRLPRRQVAPLLYMGPDETDDLSYENTQAKPVYAERVSQDKPHRDEESVHEEYRMVLTPSAGWS